MTTRTPTRITPRQKAILLLIVLEGLTNREVAARLTISPRTVEVHRYNMMRRLHCRNVAQLMSAAIRYGLISKRRLLQGAKRAA